MKNCFILFFTLISWLGLSQEPAISVSYTDAPMKEVLELVEEQSGYKFYYLEQWFDSNTYTGDFKEIPLQDWLAAFFNDTVFNYFFMEDQKIILTKNIAIIDPSAIDSVGVAPEVVSKDTKKQLKKRQPVYRSSSLPISQVDTLSVYVGKQRIPFREEAELVYGTVYDETSKLPLSNASVWIKNTSVGTATDSLGRFSARLVPGEYVMEVSLLGFQKKVIRMYFFSEGSVDIALKESYESLNEVVISGTKVSARRENMMGVNELEIEKIKLIPLVLGERDIFKTLTTLGGVDQVGEGSLGFNVRGGKEDQNLVILDEATIYNPQHFFGIFSAINATSLEEAVLYKSYIPPKFGGRLSSVFELKTKKPNIEKFTGEVSLGPATGSLHLEVPLAKEKSAVFIGGRSVHSNWILKQLNEEQLQKSAASFYDGNIKFRQKLSENSEMTLGTYYSRDSYKITTDSTNTYQNFAASLQWTKKVSEDATIAITLAHSNYNFNLEFDGQSNTDFDFKYGLQETKVKGVVSQQWFKDHQLEYGLEGKLYGIQPGERTPLNSSSIFEPVSLQKEKGLEGALFISDYFLLGEKIEVEVGLRLNAFAAIGPSQVTVINEGSTKNYFGPSFRTSFKYNVKEDLSLKAGVNSTYQFIHQLSSNTTVTPLDTWKLSSYNIEPQQGMQYALGISQDFSQRTFSASLEGYYKTSKNVLDYKAGADLLLNDNLEQEVLQGKGKSYGVELSIEKKKGFWNGALSYTYSRAFLQFKNSLPELEINNGDFFPSNYDKPHNINLFSNHKITRRYSISWNFTYQTGRPVTIPIGLFNINNVEYLLFQDRNTFRLRDYYRLDVGVNIEGNHKKNKKAHGFWNVSIYNVLGRDNPYALLFSRQDGMVKAFESTIFSLPVPTITYNLKF